jgi:hypothetical protein
MAVMSMSMYFQPKPAEKPAVEYIGDLKYTVRDRWFGGERRIGRECTAVDLPYLDGIGDTGGDVGAAARELAAAIRKHGTVSVWIGDESDAPY